MRTVLVMTWLAMSVFASPAIAQWRAGDKELPDTPWRKNVDGFGLLLSVTTQPGKDLINQFDNSPEHAKVVIRDATKIKRNQKFAIFILLADCPKDSSGNCNLRATFSIVTPDGKVAVQQKDLVLWDQPPPPDSHVTLGHSVWETNAEDTDPLGVYHVRAEVRDLVKGITVTLERELILTQ